MFTPFADLTDGDLIRRIASLRRIRTGRPMGYPRYSGEITLMLAELMARGVELDEKGNRLFTNPSPRETCTNCYHLACHFVHSSAFRRIVMR
jgi:hypothetical protein